MSGSKKSLAHKFLDEYEDETEGFWLIIYDFIKMKPSPKFWTNLTRFKKSTSLKTIQYSVLSATKHGDSQTASRLAYHYGAQTNVFKVIDS